MLTAVVTAGFIVSLASASRISLPGLDESKSLQIAFRGHVGQFNVSHIAQSGKVTHATQTSLLDSSTTHQRAYAQESVTSHRPENAESDPFPKNNEGNSSPAILKTIMGTNGRRYTYQNKLAQGGQGVVWSAIDVSAVESPRVVIKVPRQDQGQISPTAKTLFWHEVKYLNMFSKSEHVVHILDFFRDNAGLYYIVMEYMAGGDLESRLQNADLDEAHTHRLFVGLLEGLEDMHNHHVAHLDIKTRNVLLTADGTDAKFCDFGYSSEVPSQELITAGTPGYLAPEIIDKQARDGTKVDIFTLGVVLYQMVMGWIFHPFTVQFYGRWSSHEGYTDEHTNQLTEYEVDKDLIDILRCMLEKNPAARCSISQIRKMPWFTKTFSKAADQSSLN